MTTRAPITEGELRKLVAADLGALLNTVNLESAEDLVRGSGGAALDPELRASATSLG